MIAKIKVATAIKKTTSAGKGYLNVKSSTGGYANIWEENQYLWHLFVPDAELSVEAQTDGKFTTITGIVGFKPENASQGQNGAGKGNANAPTNFNEWLAVQIKELNRKLDFLVDEKIILNSLKAMDNAKDEIKIEDIPF